MFIFCSFSPDKAFSAEAIVVCVGEGAFAEKNGDLSDLALPLGISAFVKELKKVTDAATPLVLALVEGRPRLLGDLSRVVSEQGFRGVGVGVDVDAGAGASVGAFFFLIAATAATCCTMFDRCMYVLCVSVIIGAACFFFLGTCYGMCAFPWPFRDGIVLLNLCCAGGRWSCARTGGRCGIHGDITLVSKSGQYPLTSFIFIRTPCTRVFNWIMTNMNIANEHEYLQF